MAVYLHIFWRDVKLELLPEEPDEVGLGAEFALELGGEHLSLP